MGRILIVLVADVLGHLQRRIERDVLLLRPRFRKDARIFDRCFLLEVAVIDAMKLLDEVHVFRVRRAREVVPGDLVEADGVDDEPVAFPARARSDASAQTETTVSKPARRMRRDGPGVWSPPDDPAKTRRPSASLTTRALAVVEPSFAREPSTVTTSPIFSESRRQPCWMRTG